MNVFDYGIYCLNDLPDDLVGSRVYGDEYRNALVRLKDGRPVEIIGIDGGEPEDQTLTRDFWWVLKAVRSAFKLGLETAKK